MKNISPRHFGYALLAAALLPVFANAQDGKATIAVSSIKPTASLDASIKPDKKLEGNREHAQSPCGHLGVGLGCTGCSRCAEREHELDGAFDVEDAVCALDGHSLSVGVEGIHGNAWPLHFNPFAPDFALCRRNENRDFCGITDSFPLVFGELGIAIRGRNLEDSLMVRPPQVANSHDTRCKSAGLVCANHRRTTKRLNGW